MKLKMEKIVKSVAVMVFIFALSGAMMLTAFCAKSDENLPIAIAETTLPTVTAEITNNVVEYNGGERSAIFSFKDDKNVVANISSQNQTITYNGTSAKPINAGEYTVKLVLKSQSGYSLTNGAFFETKMTISKKQINITDNAIKITDKIYNGTSAATIQANSYSYSGILEGDISKINIGAEANFIDANAGNVKNVNVSYILSGVGANNYSLSKVSTVAVGNILKKTLVLDSTINIDSIIYANSQKIYDGTMKHPIAPTLKLGNAIPGEIAQIYLIITYAIKDVGENIPLTLSFSDNNNGETFIKENYILPTLPTDTNGQPKRYFGKIDKKEISVDKTKIVITTIKEYDKTDIATYELKAGAFIGIPVGENVLPIVTASYVNALVGTKNISVSFSLSTADSKNFTISFAADYVISGTILRRKLIVEGFEIESVKEFDNTTLGKVKNRGTITNICIGDSVVYTITATYGTYTIGKNIKLTVEFSDISNSNYSLPDKIVLTNGEITKRTIMFELPDLVKTKVYDGNSNVSSIGRIIMLNLIAELSDITFSVNCAYADQKAGFDKAILAKPVASSLVGAHAEYYTLPAQIEFLGSISKKTLTSATAIEVENEKEFDGTDIAIIKNGLTNVILDGIISGDDVKCSISAIFNNEMVGINKAIVFKYIMSGANADCYDIAPFSEKNNGIIKPKTVGINVSNNIYSYGNNGDISLSYTNVSADLIRNYPINIEILYSIGGVYGLQKPTEVGEYAIKIRVLSSNYTTTDGSGSYDGAQYIINLVTPILKAKDYESEYSERGLNLDSLLAENSEASNIKGVIIKVKFYSDLACTILLDEAPKNVGEYGYVLYCDGTENYGAAVSAPKKLTIMIKNAEIFILNTHQKLNSTEGNKVEVIVAPDYLNYKVEYEIDGVWGLALPKKAGKFNVRVTIQDPNYSGVKTADLTIEQNAVELVILPSSDEISPQGQAPKYTAVYNPSGNFSFTFRCSDPSVTSDRILFTYETIAGVALDGMPFDSGSYIIRAEIKGGNITGTAEVLFSIEKKDISTEIEVNPDTLNVYYDGTPKLIDAYSGKTVAFNYTIAQGGKLLKNAITSGKYTVTAIVFDKNYKGQKSYELTILKSRQKLIPVTEIPSFYYNGRKFRPEVLFNLENTVGATISNLSEVAIMYEFLNGDGLTLTEFPTNRGAYKVRARLSDEINYENITFTEYVSFNIAATNITVEWLKAQYDEENAEYRIYASFDANSRFNLRASDIKFNNQKQEEMNLFGVALIEYLIDGKTVHPVSEGKYTIRITLPSNDNYTHKPSLMTLVITPKQIENPNDVIKVIKSVYEYGDNLPHNLVIETIPKNLSYTILYFLGQDRLNPIDEEGRRIPGKYTAVVKITDPNYRGEFEFELTVNKKIVVIGISNTSFEYGNVRVPDITLTIDGVSAPQLKLIYEYYLGSVLIGNNPPIYANNYEIKVSIDDIYYEGSSTVAFIISKAELNVTFGNINKTYDKKKPTATVTYSGFRNGDTEGSLDIKASDLYSLVNCINAGTYVIDAPIGESENYKFICSPGTIVINKASLYLELKDGMELEEGKNFDLSSKDNYSITGLLEGDMSTFRQLPSIKLYNSVGEDVTGSLRSLTAGTYIAKLFGGTSDNYIISEESYQISRNFIIFSNSIKSESGDTIIKEGKFTAGATVYFGLLDGKSALYKSTKKLTGHEIFGSKILGTFELKVLANGQVVNSKTPTIVLNFTPKGIDLSNSPILYANINGSLQTVVYTVNADNSLTITLPTANCVLSFIEPVSYTWMIVLLVGIIVGIGLIIIIIKRVKFLKQLPDEVEEKGEAIEVAPIIDSVDEETQFAELIEKAESGNLEEIKEPIKKAPPIFEKEKPTSKTVTVSDRIVGMTVEKMKEEHEKEQQAKKGNDKKEKK